VIAIKQTRGNETQREKRVTKERWRKRDDIDR